MNSGTETRMNGVQTPRKLKKQECKLIGRIRTVFRPYTAERDVVHTVLHKFEKQRSRNIFGRENIGFLDSFFIERIEILIGSADTIHPIPKGVEPGKLSSLIKGLGFVKRNSAAIFRNTAETGELSHRHLSKKPAHQPFPHTRAYNR